MRKISPQNVQISFTVADQTAPYGKISNAFYVPAQPFPRHKAIPERSFLWCYMRVHFVT